MGKVFTFQEIASGKVPDPKHFNAAKDITIDWMKSLLQEGEIIGGQVFGSVAQGTATKRSDFDLILVTTERSIPDRIRDHKRLMYNAFYIPLEPILIPVEFADTPLHTIDADFLFHMSHVQGDANVVGEHPASVIHPNKPDIVSVHNDYMASKLRKFRDGFFIQDQARRNNTLQRALEAPISIGRRTLRTLGIPQVDENGNFDDTKKNITRIFRDTFHGTPLGEGFETCLARDGMYTKLLDETLQGRVSQEAYDDFVDGEGYDLALAQSLSWTSELAIFFQRTIEGSQFQTERQSRRKEYGI